MGHQEHRCPNCDSILTPKGETNWECPNYICPKGAVGVSRQ